MTVALRESGSKADSSRDGRRDASADRVEPGGGPRKRSPLSASALAEWGARLASCAPYTDRPPSLADVVGYVKAGGFVPGEHPWWVEAPGYVYGALVAVPATAVGYAVICTVQKPTRLLLVLFVLALLIAAW